MQIRVPIGWWSVVVAHKFSNHRNVLSNLDLGNIFHVDVSELDSDSIPVSLRNQTTLTVPTYYYT